MARVELADAEEVVAVRRPATLEVEAPARVGTALGDDHAVRALFGDGHLRRDGVRLVLDVDGGVLAEPRHPAEQELGRATDQGRSPRDVRVEALDAPIVEREDVVLACLLHEERLQLLELLGQLGREIVRLAPVA